MRWKMAYNRGGHWGSDVRFVGGILYQTDR